MSKLSHSRSRANLGHERDRPPADHLLFPHNHALEFLLGLPKFSQEKKAYFTSCSPILRIPVSRLTSLLTSCSPRLKIQVSRLRWIPKDTVARTKASFERGSRFTDHRSISVFSATPVEDSTRVTFRLNSSHKLAEVSMHSVHSLCTKIGLGLILYQILCT